MADPQTLSPLAPWLAAMVAMLLMAAAAFFAMRVRRSQRNDAEQAARTYSELLFLAVHSTILACRDYQPDSLRREHAMLEELEGVEPGALASPLVPARVRSSILLLKAASSELHTLVGSTQLDPASIREHLAEIEQLYGNCRYQYGQLMEYFFDVRTQAGGFHAGRRSG